MASASEVEEVFTIESGSGLVNLQVLSLLKCRNGAILEARTVKTLEDTSFLVFTETATKSDPISRKIALIKIGPDTYYPLEKDKTIVYRLSSELYLLPSTSSTPDDQYLVIRLKSGSNVYVKKQFDEILNYF